MEKKEKAVKESRPEPSFGTIYPDLSLSWVSWVVRALKAIIKSWCRLWLLAADKLENEGKRKRKRGYSETL